MQTTFFKRVCLALAVALGASAAFGDEDRPVDDDEPYEWETMDPLTVTTVGESDSNKDGVISFREALQYLQK